jgi:hypothetical protein
VHAHCTRTAQQLFVVLWLGWSVLLWGLAVKAARRAQARSAGGRALLEKEQESELSQAVQAKLAEAAQERAAQERAVAAAAGAAAAAAAALSARPGAAALVQAIGHCLPPTDPLASCFEKLSSAALRHREPRYAEAGLVLRELAMASQHAQHANPIFAGEDGTSSSSSSSSSLSSAAQAQERQWHNDADLLYVALAQMRGGAGDWRGARRLLQRAVAHTAIRTRTQFMLGEAATHLGDHAGAAKGFGTCVALEPRKILCWRKLGEALRKQGGGKLPDAEVAFARAAELEKEEAQFTDV